MMSNKKNDHIESPCTGLCIMDEKNRFCKGCLRSNLEILGWRRYTDEQKREVLEKIRRRRGGSA